MASFPQWKYYILISNKPPITRINGARVSRQTLPPTSCPLLRCKRKPSRQLGAHNERSPDLGTKHYKDLSFFSGLHHLTYYLSTFILESATFEVATAEITPFCPNAEQVRRNFFSARQTKTQCSTFFGEVPCFSCRPADFWQRHNFRPAYLFDYIIQPSAGNGKQETFASRQTVSLFFSPLQRLDSVSTQSLVVLRFFTVSVL